jgi:parallel beta-helix repeat protein
MKRQIHSMEVYRRALLAACWVTACFCSASASAICVSNDTDFAAAAVAAQLAPVTIELVQGTYHVDGTAFTSNGSVSFQGFSLLGGYTASCASRQINPTNTVITRHSGSTELFMADVVGDVTIEGIAFEGAGSGVGLSWSDYFHDIPDSVNVVIRRDIFAGADSANDLGLFLYWDANGSQALSARLVDNLIHNNGAGSGAACTTDANAAGALDLVAVEGANANFTLINNTVVNNGFGCGVSAGYTGNLTAYNNIFYGNYGPDLFSETQMSALLTDNVIGTHVYHGNVFEFGTQTGNPKLNATFHPIQSPPSPVINSGVNNVPGGLPSHDLDGGPRVVGSTVDRGAYESNVDDAFILSVTNTNDSGTGSLRQAITSANANGGFNIIEFAIGSGCGPHVITLQSHLPNVTTSMLINGYTQPGSSENTLDVGDDAVFCIVLDGDTNHIGNGFTVPSSAANGTALTLEGLAFSGFTNAAINLQGGNGHVIEGVRIGGSTSGGALAPVHDGIDLGLGVHGVTIGGSDNDKRNIIGNAIFEGIALAGGSATLTPSHDNQIINNYIGVGWNNNTNQFTNLGNGQLGLSIVGRTNTISNNIIGFNFLSGMELYSTDAHDNTVSGNYIGISPSGDNLGNPYGGVWITQDAHDNTIRGNTIADNQAAGIGINSGQHNLVRANSIHDNTSLGIDLGYDGVTPNDNDSTPPAGDPPNRGQNFPVLTSAIGGHSKGTLSGTLTSTPGDYRIELFASLACNASGNGEGEIYLGHTDITLPNITVNGQTTASFSKTVENFFLVAPGVMITATATDSSNNTSEFSACFPYTDDTIFANGFEAGFF